MQDGVSQVAEGIYQVQLPLPFELNIINAYILEDHHGWVIVDTGLNYPPAQAMWRAAFAGLGVDPRSIQRIILTHAHPDHYGMAGWLQAQSGAPVLLSPIEQGFAEAVWRSGAYNEEAFIRFFQAYGLPPDLAGRVQADMAALHAMTAPQAETTVIEPGACIEINSRRFQAIMTPGHSDGHLVFYCATERLLLSGDTVLGKITPNIGLWPRSRSNPLADFLLSLQMLDGLAVDLALPGHGPLIYAFRERIAELNAHHEERLRLVEQSAGSGATAFAVCGSVFPIARLSSHQIRFALAETLAHLEYLVSAGRLRRIDTEDVLYQQV